MNEAILWAKFLGAWLLVAGPLYQGSVELEELDLDREAIEQVKAAAAKAAENRPSPWWWLVPPVMYVLRRRWAAAFHEATFGQLTQAQQAQFAGFRSKATGWFTVAAGATLLAAGETWEVTGHYRWAAWAFWLLVVAMLAGSLLNTAIRRSGGRRRPGAGSALEPE
jgi:hypothetical protein